MKILPILAMMLSLPAYSSYIENRFSSVEKQQNDSTCGIASLSNILNIHYHIKKTELELLKYLSIKPEYSFKDLAFIASEHNINAIGIKLHTSQLSGLNMPVILHINRLGVDHFVILNNVTSTYIQISDPAWGNLNYTHAQFEKYWIKNDGFGRALIFLTPTKSTSTTSEIYTKIINTDVNNL